jgi:hypothetical protein
MAAGAQARGVPTALFSVWARHRRTGPGRAVADLAAAGPSIRGRGDQPVAAAA